MTARRAQATCAPCRSRALNRERKVPEKNIAVIGGGPKAAALAAKADCLNRFGDNKIRVEIFEKTEIGAAWNGANGYTDGEQRLCTPAERDVGFPYVDGIEPGASALMKNEYSWDAFQMTKPVLQDAYSTWVSRGRKPPIHREFANYLDYVVRTAGLTPVIGEVTSVDWLGGRWKVNYTETASGDPYEVEGFDGIVFTGPGPALGKVPKAGALVHSGSDRLYDGESFWSNLSRVSSQLRGGPRRVLIVGGGGTTAAIAAWFIRSNNGHHSIAMINNSATLFTRTVNFFESVMFDNEDAWLALSPADRRKFTDRLNRGVVWENITDILTDAKDLVLVPGRANQVSLAPGRAKRLIVEYANALGASHEHEADIVVDATGFDGWWFERLLPVALRDQMQAVTKAGLEEGMKSDLSFDLPGWPKIHAPMHSQIVAPGFMSLMALGGMADAVLRDYR